MDIKFIDTILAESSQTNYSLHGSHEQNITNAFYKCSALYKSVRKKYDDLAYSNHIRMVAAAASKNFTIQSAEEKTNIIISCFAHDLIEDARVSFNDLDSLFGRKVAEMVFAVTDYTGKNRESRAPYDKIRGVKGATYVKLCDRYANGAYSYLTGSPMFNKYKSEYAKFRRELHVNDLEGLNDGLWEHCDGLFDFEEPKEIQLNS